MADTEFDANEFLSEIVGEPSDADTPAIKRLRKMVDDLGKKLGAANKQLSEHAAEKAKEALTNTWTQLGVPEPLRGFYQGEQNADAIKAWWDASKGFFNVQAPAEGGQPPAQQPLTEQHQQLQQVAQAAALGQDAAGSLTLDAIQAEAAKLKNVSAYNNPELLTDFYAKLGLPKGGASVPQHG